jgi:hypothetical protein
MPRQERKLPPAHPYGRDRGSRLVNVQEGQPMSKVYAKFMFPQTADTDNAAVTWMLVHPAKIV